MSFSSEHRRMKPVLEMAQALDVAENPSDAALFEAGLAGFQIWCVPDKAPKGWRQEAFSQGNHCKMTGFVGAVWWEWKGEKIVGLRLTTDAWDMQKAGVGEKFQVHNRPEDIAWAKAQIRNLFRLAGVEMPPILLEQPEKKPRRSRAWWGPSTD